MTLDLRDNAPDPFPNWFESHVYCPVCEHVEIMDAGVEFASADDTKGADIRVTLQCESCHTAWKGVLKEEKLILEEVDE